MMEQLNTTLLTDFYELTMANGYFETGMADDIAYFDMFFRKIPDDGGFAIMAGLEQMIQALDNLKFDERDIEIICVERGYSVKSFWITSGILNLNAMSGQSRKGPPSSPENRWLRCEGL